MKSFNSNNQHLHKIYYWFLYCWRLRGRKSSTSTGALKQSRENGSLLLHVIYPTKELNHFYEQMMVVVSRSGCDFMPGSATRLWLCGEQWEQCIGAVCIDGSSPALL